TEGPHQKRGHLAAGDSIGRTISVVRGRVTSPSDPIGGNRLDVALVDVAVIVDEGAARRQLRRGQANKAQHQGNDDEDTQRPPRAIQPGMVGHHASLWHPPTYAADTTRNRADVPFTTPEAGSFSRQNCAPWRAILSRKRKACVGAMKPRVSGVSLPGSPDRIRTGVTGLRGRRPRPLDDGARTGSPWRTDWLGG